MDRHTLVSEIFRKKSFLCVGLDTEVAKLPAPLRDHPDAVFEFNRQIIDATRDLCVAYKPNLAFYEARGAEGWRDFERTVAYIGAEHLVIADAKRGDIGNTSGLYAKAFFELLEFDAVTVAPYMGEDSVAPFLQHKDKWVILLALTSNTGSQDFQFTPQEDNQPLFVKVLQKASQWGSPDQLMFVTGATHPEQLEHIRKVVPDHFLLAPGIGAQGGDLAAVSRYGLNGMGGLLVNASRSILYASDGKDFAEKAREAAMEVQGEMARLLNR